jgi:cell division protein FtsB
VAKRKGEKKRKKRLRLRRLGPIAVVLVVAYLYYRPLSNWMATRHALAQRAAQVQALQAQKAALEREVEQAASLTQLERSARRIGLVRAGERLFIVKGIPEWRRAHPQAK